MPVCYSFITSSNGLWCGDPKIELTMEKRVERYRTTISTPFVTCNAKVVLLYDKIDRWCWDFDTIGDYIIKSGCITIDRIIFTYVSTTIALFWKGLVPPKIEVFLWKLMYEKLYTWKFLAYKHIISHQQAICPICEYETESFSHLFLHCLEPWKLWKKN